MFSGQGDSTAVLLGLMLFQGWDEYVVMHLFTSQQNKRKDTYTIAFNLCLGTLGARQCPSAFGTLPIILFYRWSYLFFLFIINVGP